MINPLIDNLDGFTLQELDQKVSDLQRKYFMTPNPQVQAQIANVLDIYRLEQQDRRVKEMMRQQNDENGENSLDNLININKCHVVLCDESDDINLFNKAAQEQGLDKLTTYIPIDVEQKDFDSALQSEWFMPDEYKNMDIYSYLEQKCQTNPSVARLDEEFIEYDNRNMLDLLRYMVYLVDFMRENDIVWGVGRGSSVASYILFLIGVHKVNSIQYGLDYKEFLR